MVELGALLPGLVKGYAAAFATFICQLGHNRKMHWRDTIIPTHRGGLNYSSYHPLLWL